MKTYASLKQIKIKELKFIIREGTSDFKAIKEVVIDSSYKRRTFFPEAEEQWIDIGANCGAFSVWAASFGASVIGFEPDPDNAAMAEMNAQLNGFSKKIKTIHSGATEGDVNLSVMLHRNTANGNLWRNSIYKKWQGGESVKVNLVPIGQFWNKDNCIKLDAEGVEMPILEKYAKTRVKKLVFEWSFDIDSSLKRFETVISMLKTIYTNVVYSPYSAGHTQWQKSWFPACRTVFCY
jgi:FkbM family methyltransferase